MINEKQINIIGGGIAGLTTALALQTKGIKFNLFEKNAEISYDNVGLGISANIFNILKEWNILEETKQIGAEIQNFYFVDKNLNYINSFQLSRPALSVNRRLFHLLLLQRLQKDKIFLNLEKKITDFPKDEIVISAEGVHSKTRLKMYPNLKLRDAKQILWRGISYIKLDKKFKNSYHDFVESNLRFAIIHTGKDYYSWYAIKEKTSGEKITFDKAILTNLFKGFNPIVNEVINTSKSIYSSVLNDIQPKKRKHLKWYTANYLLIGDAIHPSTPNMANGGCLAMEDAYLLSHLLSKNDLSIQEVFYKFQKHRTKKADAVVNQSWWFGQLLHPQNKILYYIIKCAMSITPNFLFNKIYSTVLEEQKTL